MGKVIKVIDLLNMIAKGEELPKKIKFYDEEFVLEEKCYAFYDYNLGIKRFLFNFLNNENLNKEIEIVDQSEEIDIQGIEELERGVSRDYNPHELALMQLKINELIREVNKIKEK